VAESPLGRTLLALATATALALLASPAASTTSTAAPRSSPNRTPLSRLVGQLLMGRMTGTKPSRSLLGRIRRGELGGLIVFPDNFTSEAQLAITVASLQEVAAQGGNPPLLIATDQEGGTVARLPAGPPGRSARQMGGTGNAGVVRSLGRKTGWYLRRFGITVDLAPVLDVPDSPSNFLGTRTFDRHPAVVSELGTAFALGLQAAHVAATAKHFPGLGTATGNTDLGVVSISTRASGLRWRMRPFRDAVRAGVRIVMVSNAAYPTLDPTGLPAAISPAIVDGLLRRHLGFEGVVITDAFSTPAPAAHGDAPRRAISAGVDMLLYSDSERSSARAYTSLLREAGTKALPRARLAQSYARVIALKRWIRGAS
jgi:beta-N-acetylhexosaminidase